MQFTSDNTSGVPAEVLAALTKANEGFAPGYGADSLMQEVQARIRAEFEAPEAEVFLVPTGTAANSLALATLCPPWGEIYCQTHAHVIEDECGAPVFFTGGAKQTPVEGPHGKIAPEALEATLNGAAAVGVHSVQKGALTLTNLTEAGTAYSPSETAALTALARAHGIPTHLDGARFSNALVGQNCAPADLTWRAGVDVMSLGGTKNGLMGVEAVVFFDPAKLESGKTWEFELRRKRAGHLFSKHRFLSAQMLAWFEGDLWRRLARNANDMAIALEAGIKAVPGATLEHPRDGNILFAKLPRGVHRALQAKGARYYLMPHNASLDGLEAELIGCRLVTSWCTTHAEIEAFLTALKQG